MAINFIAVSIPVEAGSTGDKDGITADRGHKGIVTGFNLEEIVRVLF